MRTELFEEGVEGVEGGASLFCLSGQITEEARAHRGAGNRDSAVGLSFGGWGGEGELGQLYGPLNTHELAIMLLDGGTRTGRGYVGFVAMVPCLPQGDTQITAVVQPRDD